MDVSFTIIGAGVIGLAVARQLSIGREGIVVLEKNARFGQETSSRNSEVIHSGLYYPAGSLKAKLCVEGNSLLYRFCQDKGIPFRNTGKLIVRQTDEMTEKLEQLHQQAIKNQVPGTRIIHRDEIQVLEPHIRAEQALWIPTTGIIDSHSLMIEMLREATSNGAELAYQSEVIRMEKIHGGFRLTIRESEGTEFTFSTEMVINCAGLESDHLARLCGIHDPALEQHFCKGEYFRVRAPKNRLLNHLVYPLPDPRLEGLGIHATLELDGGLKLGPNTMYLDERKYDYSVDVTHGPLFFRSAQRYLPFLEPEDLVPEMAGIRPKLQKSGEPTKDFIIRSEKANGLPGLITLAGIESPGLTACLAIAEYVDSILGD